MVYWGLTPQQQPGSYRGGDDDDDEMSVTSGRGTGVTGVNHRPSTASNWQTFTPHIRPVPSPRMELGPQRCEARWSKASWDQRPSSASYQCPSPLDWSWGKFNGNVVWTGQTTTSPSNVTEVHYIRCQMRSLQADSRLDEVPCQRGPGPGRPVATGGEGGGGSAPPLERFEPPPRLRCPFCRNYRYWGLSPPPGILSAPPPLLTIPGYGAGPRSRG